MSRIRRFDHVGITVADLDAASAFFVELGFEVEGRTFLEGEFLDNRHWHTGLAYRDRHAAATRRRRRARAGEVHPA
jgi:catechol 2,3-dioxygenase-like lactoylglutathione lyase family enzyme